MQVARIVTARINHMNTVTFKLRDTTSSRLKPSIIFEDPKKLGISMTQFVVNYDEMDFVVRQLPATQLV